VKYLVLTAFLVLSSQTHGNPVTLIHFGLTGETIRLTPEHSVDSGILQAAIRVCSDIEQLTEVPAYFCLAQVSFTQKGKPYTPAAWPIALALSLRRQVMTSKWLMGELGTSVNELQDMPRERFITRFLRDPNMLKIIKSWVISRAAQIQTKILKNKQK
jgi:hypothetical protein